MSRWFPAALGLVLLLPLVARRADGAPPPPAVPYGLAYPGVSPVMVPEGAAPQAVKMDDALFADLGATDYERRERAAARIVQVGEPAVPELRRRLAKADPDSAWWLRAALQQIEGGTSRTGSENGNANLTDWLGLIAKGPTPETLGVLRGLPPVAVAQLVERHLRLELGMDCLYSLRPRQVLPRALALLAVQQEPFYQALLLRLIRNVLERALMPLPGTPGAEELREGMRYASDHPELAATVRPFLAHANPLLRREALLICAWAQIELAATELTPFERDADPETARQARLLRGLFQAGGKPVADAEVGEWLSACCAALNQDADRLAQLGAFYAVRELLVEYHAEVDQQCMAATGRAKDALLFLLTRGVSGRACLVRRGVRTMPDTPPASLSALIELRNYDLMRQGTVQVGETPASVLARRNQINDDASGYTVLTTSSRNSRQALPPQASAVPAAAPGGGASGSRAAQPVPAQSFTEFRSWYDGCVRAALSTKLSVATGGVRGLLVSDLAGARALVEQCGTMIAADTDVRWSFPRDLFLLHPAIGSLPAAELPDALRQLWQTRTIDGYRTVSGRRGDPLFLTPAQVPAALWGFVMQSDTAYTNPVGRALETQLSLRQLPLLLAFLEYDSRTTCLLAALEAVDAVPAIRRDVLDRRPQYYRSNDYDLFHGVARFAILDAVPVLETHAKQNQRYPIAALHALAGYEQTRYGAGEPFLSGDAQPLAIGVLREFFGMMTVENPQTQYLVSQLKYAKGHEFIEKGLFRMGYTGEAKAKDAPATPQ